MLQILMIRAREESQFITSKYDLFIAINESI